MSLPTYSTGTVSVSADGAVTVAGGGIWSGLDVVAGDQILVDGAALVMIDEINADAIHAQLFGWGGGDVTGKTYVVKQCSSLRFDDVQIALDLTKQVSALNTDGFEVFVGADASGPDPSKGDNGQYAYQPTTKKRWRKDSGLWTYLGMSDAIFTRYDIAIFDTDRPASGEEVLKNHPSGVFFETGLPQSYASAEVAPTSNAVYSITKNGVQFATVTFSAGNSVGTIACPSTTSFSLGDALRIIAPNPRDDTLSGVAVTLIGSR